MRATNIEWDVSKKIVDLPEEMEIPDDVINDEDATDDDAIIDIVSEFLESETGFCTRGFVIEE